MQYETLKEIIMNESKRLTNPDARFQFGKNWSRFLKKIDNERITIAAQSLKNMLKVDDLNGKRFLDIGSGSGLFSLAARRLGANVYSFDYDIHSVACTEELKRRYLPNDSKWHIEQGSVLDADYLHSLGKFEIVYAWGVLFCTGDMWQAMANVSIPVADRGKLVYCHLQRSGRQIASLAYCKKFLLLEHNMENANHYWFFPLLFIKRAYR